ncbi:hypothetical protein SAMN05216337_1008109 [Bradyrhizobium brasilense]|uniref:Uncharacterized protein n=2 Tax=Bradyrhizobium brasilense TaxID=1419277 RepID=A0A1G6SHZ3_9BRAD|nr:hypothetical protein [Bradyrhizobium brasilense]SDD16458.1 hypothetical protein SAMN05216337_1008109 [Bradyrhizobium brasilense]
MQAALEVHLVRVTTDDGEVQIWLAATSRDQALDLVLDAIPEGWAVSLMQRQLTAEHISMLDMMLGEARRHEMSRFPAANVLMGAAPSPVRHH